MLWLAFRPNNLSATSKFTINCMNVDCRPDAPKINDSFPANLSFKKRNKGKMADQTNDRVLISGCDIDGQSRGKLISLKKFKSSLANGLGFCSVVFGWDLHDEIYNPSPQSTSSGWGDVIAMIDQSSMRMGIDGIPHYLVDFHSPQSTLPLDFCPRSLLKRVLATTEMVVNCGVEFGKFGLTQVNT